jgi:hypothetical protein
MSRYTKAVERNLEGLEAVSVGPCPGCEECADNPEGESGFSWSSCGVCGSTLGGDRFPWHFIFEGEIQHADDCCVDCYIYIANGEEPEDLRKEFP